MTIAATHASALPLARIPMSAKHRQWHKAWKINYDDHTATHESGLVVRFERDGDAWQGVPPTYARAKNAVSTESAKAAYRAINTASNSQETAQRYAELMRQAGDAWTYAQANKEHLQADPTSRRRNANPLKANPKKIL
jgi:hypothetical protein